MKLLNKKAASLGSTGLIHLSHMQTKPCSAFSLVSEKKRFCPAFSEFP